ncbi:MAG: phosphoribosylglycinamide formyltransferase [Gemmatimonadetes bacterium]|nr:phosphoribosylglycinamide formyltransferase [Gemmatimonadota bacterium]
MKNVAVIASGGGSNLGALLSYLASLPDPAPAQVRVVLSDRADAGALIRARDAGIAAEVIPDVYDGAALSARLEGHDTHMVVLAGYLKLVPMHVTVRYAGAIVNVHPALLPAHGGEGLYGARVHRAVLAAGDAESGATVHFVDSRYDRGAPIVRAHVPVAPDDTAETLAARVLVAEHFVLPRAVHALSVGIIALGSSGALLVGANAAPLFAGPPSGVTIRLAG